MPIPLEYHVGRRMSTITVPKQDINFNTYDFEFCKPQTDIQNAFEARNLETAFCRDFSCCGLVLNDLHDLLQHYEECHVRLEDEELSDEGLQSFWSTPSSPSSMGQSSYPVSPTLSFGDDDVNPNMTDLKKRAAAYLSDVYNTNSPISPVSPISPMTPVSPISPISPISPVPETLNQDDIKAVGGAAPAKKRTFSHMANSAVDLLTQSAAKKLALATSGELPNLGLLTDEEFLARAGVLLSSTASSSSQADRPYKCPVKGCDKAYKNPNGLKYHSQHGHCNLVTDDAESASSKPYQCTIGECGKRYKNLNGLKYHIEHSHMAALNSTLAAFGSSLLASTESLLEDAYF